jgi:hypothetical protein
VPHPEVEAKTSASEPLGWRFCIPAQSGTSWASNCYVLPGGCLRFATKADDLRQTYVLRSHERIRTH